MKSQENNDWEISFNIARGYYAVEAFALDFKSPPLTQSFMFSNIEWLALITKWVFMIFVVMSNGPFSQHYAHKFPLFLHIAESEN